jgi:hypothetical protein
MRSFVWHTQCHDQHSRNENDGVAQHHTDEQEQPANNEEYGPPGPNRLGDAREPQCTVLIGWANGELPRSRVPAMQSHFPIASYH